MSERKFHEIGSQGRREDADHRVAMQDGQNCLVRPAHLLQCGLHVFLGGGDDKVDGGEMDDRGMFFPLHPGPEPPPSIDELIFGSSVCFFERTKLLAKSLCRPRVTPVLDFASCCQIAPKWPEHGQ